MAKLYIDLSGRAGLAPKYQGDMNDSTGQPQRRYIGSANEIAEGIFSPLRRYGYMSSVSNTFVSVTPASDSFGNIRATIYDSSSQDYYLGDQNGTIWQGDDATDFTLAKIGPVPGVSPKLVDFEIYQVNGSRKLFYLYTNNAGTNCGIANIPFGSADDDWLSTVPVNSITITTVGNPFLIPADNGYLYLVATNAVHKIDGTTAGGVGGTITQNVLLFPADFNLSDGFDWKGNIWLAVQTASSLVGVSNSAAYSERVVGVYVWDRQSTQIRMQDFIPMIGVKEIRSLFVSPGGKVRAIVVSSERFVQLREYNGTTFEIIEELGLAAYPQYRDSVTKLGGLTVWLAADGYFYAHGRVSPKDNEALFKFGDATSILTGTFTAGALLLLDGNSSTTTARSGIIWGGEISGSTTYVRVWYPFGEGTINSVNMIGNVGNVYTLIQLFPYLAKVNYARVYHLPGTTSGTTVRGTLSWYLNQSTTATGTTNIIHDDIARGYKYLPIGKSGNFAISFKLTFTVDQLMGSADWFPRVIEVDYDETSKLK